MKICKSMDRQVKTMRRAPHEAFRCGSESLQALITTPVAIRGSEEL